jgi:hypothetical protein
VYTWSNGELEDDRDYSWKLSNGSSFFVPANAGSCPTRYALSLAENINAISPNAYAYADMGAAEPRAIGILVSIYSSQLFKVNRRITRGSQKIRLKYIKSQRFLFFYIHL